jgi:pyridoxine kinase
MARVLAISSHVVRGHVGLSAAVPALQWLGHEVWTLPTVLLASRPGLGRFVRHELPLLDLGAMLTALEADGCWATIDAVLTGYFPSAGSVKAVAEAVARIKQAKPGISVLVDPILGDAGQLYINGQTAAAIRDHLLPLATIATPNLFELQWLTGAKSPDLDAAKAAQTLGPPIVAVTSARETKERISTLLMTSTASTERSATRRRGIPNGPGDVFSGLLLGHLLNGQSTLAAFDASLADLDRVLAASENEPVLKLSALSARHA